MNYVKAACLWLGFLVVAIACGIIRERFLVPGLGPLGWQSPGHPAGGRDYFWANLCVYREIKGGDPSRPVQTGLMLDDGDDRV